MKKKIWWLLGAAAIVVAAFLAFGGRGKAEAKYRTETVDRGAITQAVTASGFLSAVTTVKVGSQVSGIIQSLHADFNSPVKKGQLLAELDPSALQARLDQNEANLERANVERRNAEIALRRQKRLAEEGLSPQADVDGVQATADAARASVEQAQATVKQARTDLSYTKIYSPIDGVVVNREYDIGQTVAASFQAPTIFTIAQDLTKMQVAADVSESDIGRIQLGQPVRFTVDAYPNREFRGDVDQIRLNATVNQNVVTYPVIIAVANPEGILRPNMTANVSIDVASVADTMRVPNAALRWRPEGATAADAAAAPAAGGPEGSAARSAAGSSRGTGGGAPRTASGGRTRTGGQRPTRQVVWTLPDPSGEPKAIEVRTGISDGRYTQIVGGDLAQGQSVIVGYATSKAEGSGAFPGASGAPRGPGGGGGRRPI
jgi:HlyD family secretion protein